MRCACPGIPITPATRLDRLHREERIKQINAAWDLLKNGQRAEMAEPVNS